MKLTVLAFGKLKTPGLREAADHYLKHLRGIGAPVEELELRSSRVDVETEAARRVIQQKESATLEEKIAQRLSGGRGSYVLLDEEGKARPTREWARQLERWERDEAWTEAIFCLGSSQGFAPAFRERARWVLSFGPQTLPHELARVVLYEQLFRASAVRKGHPYHNES